MTASPARAGLSHELAADLGSELVRRASEDYQLMERAHAVPARHRRDLLTKCQRENAEALRTIVGRHGWPTADLVGEQASTAALMILLHAPDRGFQLTCRDLIAEAVEDGRCPVVHHAYIADHCAVEQGKPQFYGTRVDPRTLRPYPVVRPESVEERRADIGLGPLDQQTQALRPYTTRIGR